MSEHDSGATASDRRPREDEVREDLPAMRIGAWRLYEPATTITDVLLALQALSIASLIVWFDLFYFTPKLGPRELSLADLPLEQRLVVARVSSIALALCAVGIAALLGAWVHGSGPAQSSSRRSRLWTGIGMSMATASTMLYAVAATLAVELGVDSLRDMGVVIFVLVAAFSWLGYGLAQRRGEGFGWAQTSLGVSALTVGVMALLRALATQQPFAEAFARAWWIGCAIYACATVLQRLKIGLHRHFDHNALYHVLQMAAIMALGYFAVGADLGIFVQYLSTLVE